MARYEADRPRPQRSLTRAIAADRTEQEGIRLLLESAVYDPLTHRFLAEAGVSPGMRVLELGSGAGSVALLLADLVGPDGLVVGVECNPAMVQLARRRAQAAGKTNVTIVGGEIESFRQGGPYDALVGRFILREIKDAPGTLRALGRLLSPGGIVAFQEKVLAIPLIGIPRMPAVEKAWGWMSEARARAGVAVETGGRLPELLVAAGMPTPRVRCDAPVGYGRNWAGLKYLVETLRGMLPVLHLYQIVHEPEDAVEILGDELKVQAGDTGMIVLTPCIGAWTIRQGISDGAACTKIIRFPRS
jgi:predicted O-methyltransferase YrrM